MTAVTRRDEAWHVVLTTACKNQAFDRDDVFRESNRLGIEIADRTATRVLSAMDELGYLTKIGNGVYQLSAEFTHDVLTADLARGAVQ